jgi:hypothetical protein
MCCSAWPLVGKLAAWVVDDPCLLHVCIAGAMTDYELHRQELIARNKARLEQLALKQASAWEEQQLLCIPGAFHIHVAPTTCSKSSMSCSCARLSECNHLHQHCSQQSRDSLPGSFLGGIP